ncbi:MAG TPA: hypothetical protein V6C65_04125 [Allocoleopsis sp.]
METRYLITSKEAAALTGFTASYIAHLSHQADLGENDFPKPIRRGRMFFHDRDAVLHWLVESKQKKPPLHPRAIERLGEAQFDLPAGDRILNIDQVMKMLGVKRSWFQEALRWGIFPAPDFKQNPPRPNYWLESTVMNWINQPDLRFSFRRKQNQKRKQKIYSVILNKEVIGEIKRIATKKYSRANPDNEVIHWQPIGTKLKFENKTQAARWIYNNNKIETAELPK